MAYTAQQVKELRDMTGAGMLDCKNALQEADGNMEKAIETLRKRNAAVAVKKLSRDAKDGLIQSYIHGEGRIGVLVEVNSETDFVARSDDFKAYVKEVCLQIAAMNARFVTREEVPADEVAKQKEIFLAQLAEMKKPPEVLERIVEGKLTKWYAEICLMEQAYIRDDTKTVKDLQNDVIGRCGENIKVRRFARYALGEGL